MDLIIEIVNTLLAPGNAEVTFQYLPDPLTSAPTDFLLTGQLVGPRGPGAEGCESTFTITPVKSTDGFVRARTRILNPALWSPESPCLYHASLRLTRRDESWTSSLSWGFKQLSLNPKTSSVNGEVIYFRGTRLTEYLDTPLLKAFHRQGINTLLVPLGLATAGNTFCDRADEIGFLVVYEVSPEDEEALWAAEARLFNHVSTLGFVLPQAAMREPQLWHNAMLHLHGHRRDVYIGIRVESTLIGLIQGHVEFLLAAPTDLTELVDVKVAKLAFVRRPDLVPEDLPPGIVGHISRIPPVV